MGTGTGTGTGTGAGAAGTSSANASGPCTTETVAIPESAQISARTFFKGLDLPRGTAPLGAYYPS